MTVNVSLSFLVNNTAPCVSTRFLFNVAASSVPKCRSRDQHCEMPGCTDEVWAACSVGTCLTLLCYEHFCGTSSSVHELNCKGRGCPKELKPVTLGLTTSPKPTTSTIPVNVSENEQLLMSSTQATSTSVRTTVSSQATDSTQQLLASSNQIDIFASQFPFHPDVKVIPKQLTFSKNRKRVLSFQAGWFAEFPWLHYCNDVQGVLCFYCVKAEASKLSNLARKRETAFIVDGFTNWKKGIDKFKDHQNSQSHRFAMQQLVQCNKPVDQQLSSQQNVQ